MSGQELLDAADAVDATLWTLHPFSHRWREAWAWRMELLSRITGVLAF